MGHTVGKELYRALGVKIDESYARAPWNETFGEILAELYSPEDAEFLLKMPFGANTFSEVARISGYDGAELQRKLDSLCDRGLIIDLFVEEEYRYIIAPMVVGIFEFTMMRTDQGIDSKKVARLFHEYLDSGVHTAGNYAQGEHISMFRAIPHTEAVPAEAQTEILDYEKAAEVVASQDTFALSLCSCRHEKQHLGTKQCDQPLEMCTTYGRAAEFAIRRGLAKAWSKTEALEHVERSREEGLVFCADNVQNNVWFICHCCGCCCNALAGLARHGYTNAVTTSTYVAEWDDDTCKGCPTCVEACPVDAITMVPDPASNGRRKQRPVIDADRCLGCGVCALKCRPGAMHLSKRGQRVIHPENAFARIMLSALERGTIQNLFFDNPHSFSQKFLRAFVGGFFKLEPIKRVLFSDKVRSRFLKGMADGVTKQGQGWIARM